MCALTALLPLLAVSCRQAEHSAPETPLPEIVTTKGGIEMVLIPAGTFRMGSDRGKPDEAPGHEVQLDAFLIDRYEVTQAAYTRLMRINRAHFQRPDRPVEMISWDHAALYCNKRSKDEGLKPCYDEDSGACDFAADGYRLPTEAEWECACRAGTQGDYSFGDDAGGLGQYACFAENSGKQTAPVGQKRPNPWGLYDMHGNVAEWCNDVYRKDYYQSAPAANPRGPAEGELRVLRGGAWSSGPELCRSAARVGQDPGSHDACFARNAVGFRCVRRASQATRLTAPATPPAAAKKAGDAKPAKTGLVYGEIYLHHQTGRGHPERPERLSAIMKRLETSGLLEQLVRIEPRPAGRESLAAVHSPEHLAKIEKLCREGSAAADAGDTPVSRQSYEAALAAAGGVMAAVDAVVEGRVRNAFCAVRPPGHHATRTEAMGFCLLNNVAVAARYAQQKHKLARVLIVDWDVHHGNGTQAIFNDDPSVFYFSVHQSPLYPGTGAAEERGEGKAQGTKLNVPLAAGAGDAEYRQAFEEQLQPAARQFRPDFVLISAGFDAHDGDLLGRMKVTAEGFAALTRIVKRIAAESCGGRLVSVLEGGYNLQALAEAAEAHLRALQE